MIYALLSQNFVVEIYAPFPQIFWNEEQTLQTLSLFGCMPQTEPLLLKCVTWIDVRKWMNWNTEYIFLAHLFVPKEWRQPPELKPPHPQTEPRDWLIDQRLKCVIWIDVRKLMIWNELFSESFFNLDNTGIETIIIVIICSLLIVNFDSCGNWKVFFTRMVC